MLWVIATLLDNAGWFTAAVEYDTWIATVELTVRLGYAIFTVATLAFLGIAAGDVTTPDWGVDINQTSVLIQAGQWWPTIFPAIAIALLVIAVNLLADTIDRVNKA